MRYPWETIVKLYRSQKGRGSHSTVEKWGSDFVRYIVLIVKVDAQERKENIQSVVISALSEIRQDIRNTARARKIPEYSPDFKQIVKERL